MNKKTIRTAKTMVGVLLGNAILAFVVAAFVLPHGLVMGGATGLGLTLTHYFPSIDLSIIIFLINGILFIFGAAVFGKKFALSTIASTILYPILLKVVRLIPGIDSMTDNVLLSAIYAGIILGAGIGIIIRVGASTGGSDIIALIINKGMHIPIAICMYAVDFAIIALQVKFSTPEQLLLGVLALLLVSIVLAKVTVAGQAQIQLFIISDQYIEIKEKLLEEMGVGATLVKIETGLEGKEQSGVLCVIPNRRLYRIKEMIQMVDHRAFITISQINEVRGRGFTLDRDYK